MNVHRIIEEALEGNDDITLPNQADQELCSDDGVMKLASALNFIGNNLENAVPSQEEILAQAELLSSLEKEAGMSDYRGAVSRAADKLHTKILTRPGLNRTKEALADMASRTGGKAMAQDVAGATALAGTAYAAGKLGKKLLGKKKKEQKKEAKLKEMGMRALQFAKQNPEATGAAAGATVGAGIGAARAEKGKRLKGALVGGTIGAGTGAATAHGAKLLQAAKKSATPGAMPKPNTVPNPEILPSNMTKQVKTSSPEILGVKAGKKLTADDMQDMSRSAKKRAKRRLKQQQSKTSSAKPMDMRELIGYSLGQAGLGYSSIGAGAVGSHKAIKEMRQAGMSDEEISKVLSRKGGAFRGALRSGALGFLLSEAGRAAAPKLGLDPTRTAAQAGATGQALGAVSGYLNERKRGRLAIAKHKKRMSENKKTASLQKIAEDRINPAQISAGPADPYSGEIMPNPGKVSNEFIGNTRDHHALIALKAQKVRDRINKDMKQYVSNVGDGYNLKGHLSKMNK